MPNTRRRLSESSMSTPPSTPVTKRPKNKKGGKKKAGRPLKRLVPTEVRIRLGFWETRNRVAKPKWPSDEQWYSKEVIQLSSSHFHYDSLLETVKTAVDKDSLGSLMVYDVTKDPMKTILHVDKSGTAELEELPHKVLKGQFEPLGRSASRFLENVYDYGIKKQVPQDEEDLCAASDHEDDSTGDRQSNDNGISPAELDEDESDTESETVRTVPTMIVYYLDVLVGVQPVKGRKESAMKKGYDSIVFKIVPLVAKQSNGQLETLRTQSVCGFQLPYEEFQTERLGDLRHKIAKTAVVKRNAGYADPDPKDDEKLILHFGAKSAVYYLEDHRDKTATPMTRTAHLKEAVNNRLSKVTKNRATGNRILEMKVALGKIKNINDEQYDLSASGDEVVAASQEVDFDSSPGKVSPRRTSKSAKTAQDSEGVQQIMERLYNDEESFWHHGFVKEMGRTIENFLVTHKTIRETITELLAAQDVDWAAIERLLTICNSQMLTDRCGGLSIEKDRYGPIDGKQPSLAQVKKQNPKESPIERAMSTFAERLLPVVRTPVPDPGSTQSLVTHDAKAPETWFAFKRNDQVMDVLLSSVEDPKSGKEIFKAGYQTAKSRKSNIFQLNDTEHHSIKEKRAQLMIQVNEPGPKFDKKDFVALGSEYFAKLPKPTIVLLLTIEPMVAPDANHSFALFESESETES